MAIEERKSFTRKIAFNALALVYRKLQVYICHPGDNRLWELPRLALPCIWSMDTWRVLAEPGNVQCSNDNA